MGKAINTVTDEPGTNFAKITNCYIETCENKPVPIIIERDVYIAAIWLTGAKVTWRDRWSAIMGVLRYRNA